MGAAAEVEAEWPGSPAGTLAILRQLADLAAVPASVEPAGSGEAGEAPRRPAAPPPVDDRARRVERRYRTLVEQIPAVVFLAALSDDDNEIYVSPQIEALLGFSQREWLENPLLWYSQLHPDDHEAVAEAFTRGMNTGEPFRAEVRFFARDGRVVWIQGEARLVRDQLGRPEYFQGVAFDITASKEAQRLVTEAERVKAEEAGLRAAQLTAANEELQGLNEQLREATVLAEEAATARETFLATMSHELRTPLNSVIVLAYLLGETELNASQRDMLHSLELSAGYLFDLINDVLDFSRLKANRVEIIPRSFDLQHWLEDTLEIVAPRAAEKGLGLRYRLSPDVPLIVEADDSRLRQILVNLLANAVKFTPSGDVVVRLRAEPAGGDLTRFVCSVSDTGIGIEADRLGLLFDEFSQADSGIAREFGGSGLGLAICRSLAELMGGEVTVQSEPGVGSEFTFTWVCPAGPREAAPPDPLLAGRSCLIFDDRSADADLLADLVRSLGMTAAVAAGIDQALAWLRAGRCFDLAVVGHTSAGPAMALVDSLVAAQTATPLPVVVSAYAGAQPAPRSKGTRYAGLLRKPLRQSSLGCALVSVLRTGKLPDVGRDRPLGSAPPVDLRILVVDDHDMNRHAADLLLRSLGYRAEVVSSGPEAIEALSRHDFDLVLMDLAMPGMDGLTATGEIRRLGAAIHQPRIVALTANTVPRDRAACLGAGMDGVLTKPIDRGELLQALARASAAPGRASREPAPAAPGEASAVGDGDHDDSVLREIAAQFGAGAARQFVTMFRRSSANAPEKIVAALADGRTEEAHRLAHTLKSSARLVGATALARRSEEVEAHLAQNDLAAATRSVATLHQITAKALRRLEASQEHGNGA